MNLIQLNLLVGANVSPQLSLSCLLPLALMRHLSSLSLPFESSFLLKEKHVSITFVPLVIVEESTMLNHQCSHVKQLDELLIACHIPCVCVGSTLNVVV